VGHCRPPCKIHLVVLDYAVEAAELDDVNFHTRRHTFASWAVMRGVSLKELQELLGHASLTMTMRYAHLANFTAR
jgi:site-specific recombinase XerD